MTGLPLSWLPLSWLVDTLIVTGALIALVLVLRRPVARLFGPGMAYALWSLPLLRLLLPPLVLPAAPVESAAPQAIVIPLDTAAAPPVDPGLPWDGIALAVWLAGVALFIAWRLHGYGRMRRTLLDGARPVGEVGAVRIVETPATQAPVAFGVRDKVVALPLGYMFTADRHGRDLAIAHELEHHAGRDLAVNLAMQPLLALHWFNPLAWAGWRAMRRDQEAACDARVLAGADRATRAAYGRLIAGFANSPRLALAAPMACPVIGEKSIIHRLRSLAMHETTPRRRLLGRALIGAGALALPLTASISYAAADDAPAPPAAPPAPKVHTEHRIVMIDKHGGKDGKLKTRVITRDGKTIVIKSDKDLTDAEIEARVDKALAALPELPAPPAPPAPPAEPEAPVAPDGHKVRKIIVLNGDGDAKWAEGADGRKVIMLRRDGDPARMAMLLDGKGVPADCKDGKETSEVTADGTAGGKRQIVRMRFCHAGNTQAHALEAMRKARARLAEDQRLSDEVRKDVTEELDREIERLSSQG